MICSKNASVIFCQKPAKSIFFYHIPLISDRKRQGEYAKTARPSRKRPGLYIIRAWQMPIFTPSELQIRKNGKKRRPSRHGQAILDESDEFYGFWVLVDDLHETDGGTFHASSIRIYSYIYISEKKIIRISFTISVQIDRCRPIHSKYIGLFVFPTI